MLGLRSSSTAGSNAGGENSFCTYIWWWKSFTCAKLADCSMLASLVGARRPPINYPARWALTALAHRCIHGNAVYTPLHACVSTAAKTGHSECKNHTPMLQDGSCSHQPLPYKTYLCRCSCIIVMQQRVERVLHYSYFISYFSYYSIS